MSTYAVPASDATRPAFAGNGHLWAAAAVALWGLFTPNAELIAASALVLAVAVSVLRRPSEPPILLLVVGFQWLQVTVKVFEASLLGVPLNSLTEFGTGAPLEPAAWIGLLALLALVAGQRLGRGQSSRPPAQSDADISISRLFGLYACLALASIAIPSIASQIAALRQPLLVLADLKWVPLFILDRIAVSYRRGQGLLGVAILFEVLLGFGGYFSGFKTVFFIVLVAAFSGAIRLTASQRALAVGLALTVFSLTVFWQGIKGEYRVFLNQGTESQTVQVGWGERAGRIAVLASGLDRNAVDAALDAGISRLAYIDFLAEVLENVPAHEPHADGKIWGSALRHVLVPRFLDPSKPPLPSDSDVTIQYSGVYVAGDDVGVSISIGYVAESYADFGWAFFWVPVFLMGVLQGAILAYFARTSPDQYVGAALSVVSLLPGLAFETVSAKYLGGTLATFLVCAVLVRFYGAWFARWIRPHALVPDTAPQLA